MAAKDARSAAEAAGLQAEREALGAALVARESEVADLRADRDRATTQLSALRTEADSLTVRATKLETHLAALEADARVSAAPEEMEALRVEIQRLGAALASEARLRARAERDLKDTREAWRMSVAGTVKR